MGTLGPNPGPLNVMELVILSLMTTHNMSKAQDSNVRKTEQGIQASGQNSRTSVSICFALPSTGEETEAQIGQVIRPEFPSRWGKVCRRQADLCQAPTRALCRDRSHPHFPARSLGGLESGRLAAANAAVLADGRELMRRAAAAGMWRRLKSWMKIARLRSIDTQYSIIRLGKSIKSVWFSPWGPGNCTEARDQRPTGTRP